jgi:hypothetical protein
MKNLDNVSNAKFECLDDGDFVETHQSILLWMQSSFIKQCKREKRETKTERERERMRKTKEDKTITT